MAYEYLKVDRTEGVLVLTLHDPPTRNALGREMAAELMQALDEYEASSEDRMLVITGTDPSFCSGANVRQMGQRIQEQEGQGGDASDETPARLPWGSMEAGLGRRRPDDFGGGAAMVPLRIHELQKPSLAAVNGHAYGVGMGVAISCDIRIASEQAAFAEAFVRMGPDSRGRELLAVAPPHWAEQHLSDAVHRASGGRQRGVPHGAGQQGCSPR